MTKDELEEQISKLPQELRDVVEACCNKRNEALDRAQEVCAKLTKMADQIEQNVLPNPLVNDAAKRGAQRVVDLCRDADKTIHELVSSLAHADAIASLVMDTKGGSDKLQ